MAIVNHAKREINAKLVYFGPAGTGKATSLRYVYDRIKPSLRGELKTLSTGGASLLFFDFSPFEQPVFDGYRLRLHIYTLHGAVTNPAAWKMTLKGADGIMVLADAEPLEFQTLQLSLMEVRSYLAGYGVGKDDIPLVVQLNKADLAASVQPASVSGQLGMAGGQVCLTVATSGEGVLEALTTLSRLVLDRLREREDMRIAAPQQGAGHSHAEAVYPDTAGLAEKGMPDTVKPHGVAAPVHIAVAGEGVSIDGSTVRIPLQVSGADAVQHLVLTISLLPE